MICIERRKIAGRHRRTPLPIYIPGMRSLSNHENKRRFLCLVDRHRCGTGRMAKCVTVDMMRFLLFRINSQIEKILGM